MNCKPYCHITTGFSGAGAFSDGKLSLSCDVGGDLPSLIGVDLIQSIIEYADSIYLEFGADTHVEGAETPTRSSKSAPARSARDCGWSTARSATSAPRRRSRFYYAIEHYLREQAWNFFRLRVQGPDSRR